uniref:Microtubule associated protein 7 n=1 Tax=Sphenodon punctatus TaxID=8508 RepID=A0A8D0H7C7_SPHPU
WEGAEGNKGGKTTKTALQIPPVFSYPPPVLKVDDRQRLARVRREEREKQIGELSAILKKLEEQRIKEERRRAAVEEKRRQRIEEDKERHEAVVRRTIERSQKPKKKQNRWSWGGALHSNHSINNTDPDRRSVSTMNLSKHVDPVINKRLSSSSATLLNSPDRARRLQLSPWESSIVSRLLMPTHSFLARSKSTAALSGDAASCSPISPLSFKTISCRNPPDRAKVFATTPDAIGRRRTTHTAGTHKKHKERESSSSNPLSGIKRAHSPTNPKTRLSTSSPVWHASKSLPFLPGTPKPITSPAGSSKVATAQARPPSPGNIRPIKKEPKLNSEKKEPEKESKKATEGRKEKSKSTLALNQEVENGEVLPVQPETLQGKSTFICLWSGERILFSFLISHFLSNRVCRHLTFVHYDCRQKKEELSQRIAEERARREEEARLQEAERKEKEAEQEEEKKEQLRRQAEEKEQKEREETERLQKQKEEEARLREEAERIRLERERHFQREEQERLERKKVTERSRSVRKSNEQQNGEIPKTNITGEEVTSPTSPLQSVVGSQLPCVTESPRNGEPVTHTHMVISHQPTVNKDSNFSTGKQPNENGVSMQNDNFEEIISLPIGSKSSRLDAVNNDGNNSPEIPLNPILAFEDKGTLGPLPQVDNVQTHQTAEVI